jgi:putative Mg2+ transporter-C (MgtC) family protein
MNWTFELELLARISLAALFGFLVGRERERRNIPAGERTHSLVALGAALFTILSIYAFPGSDPARIAANIVTGVGFLGAGLILHRAGQVHGLTTAADVWSVSAVGMAFGSGQYLLAVGGSLLIFIILRLKGRAESSDEAEPDQPS